MSKALEKAGRLQAKRLVYAKRIKDAVVSEFQQRYAHYIYGMPFFRTTEEMEEYSRKQGGTDDAQRIKHGWDTTTFPLHGMHRNAMMPYLVSNDPIFLNRQRKGADAMEMARVDLFCDVATAIWKENQTTREVQRACEDAHAYRIGWMKTVYDPAMNLPRHMWVDARNMLIDCETKSPRMTDRRWVAEEITLPIETAEWFAKNVWDAGKYEFEPVEFEAPDEPEGKKVRNARSRDQADEDAPTEFVRLVMVEVRGENPWSMSARYKSRRMNDPAGKDDVYVGKDHVLVMEARGGFGSAEHYKVVARIDWQFPCKRGRFTYTPFMLTKDNRGVYPYNIMQPGHAAQVSADVAMQAYNTDSRNSARRWGAYQPEAFQDGADAKAVVEGDEALVMVPLKINTDPQRAIAIGNFGSPNQHLNLTFAANRENFEAIQGMNKFDVQVRANQTAFNTSVQNEAAQVKIEDLAKLIEASVVELAEKGVMCARANMTNDDVAKWINMPTEVAGQPVARQMLTSAKTAEPVHDLWPNNPDWDDIRREVEVNLEPRSIRFNNPDKEAANVKEIADYQMQVARIIGDTVAKGGVAAAQEIARTANETIKMLAQLKNIVNYERILFDFDKIGPPVPEPATGGEVLNAQMQNAQMQGEINAQQQAAVQRMIQQGANPEAMPQAMQGGV